MNYVMRKPAPPLDALIDTLWLLTDAPSHARERIVPAGTFELVVNLQADEIRVYAEDGTARRHGGAVVSGAFTRSFVVDTQAHASMLGVHFQPGGAPAFLGAAADALRDSHVALADIWSPAAATSLRDALCSASTAADRFSIMERALRDRMIHRLAGRPCTQALLRRPGRSVLAVATELGKSHRSFIRAFSAEAGLTPKLFLRIQRFNAAFRLAAMPDRRSWAELAVDCGYYDQSHLIRDFAEFADVTPAAFARLPAELVKPDHIAIG